MVTETMVPYKKFGQGSWGPLGARPSAWSWLRSASAADMHFFFQNLIAFVTVSKLSFQKQFNSFFSRTKTFAC
jgi:hypothetical protein